MKEPRLTEAAAEEMAAVIGALLDAQASATAIEDEVQAERILRLTFAGPFTGTLTVGFERSNAAALTRLVMALDDEPPEAAINDTLIEICEQAIGALGQRDQFKGLRLAGAEPAADRPATAPSAFRLVAGERFTGAVCLWNESTAVAPRREDSAFTPGVAVAPPNLEVILDIDLPLSVRFGTTEMTLSALTRLQPGSVIDLERSPDDPVDVLVNNKLVARGEVVVVSGNYGVRITEVISAADRLRTMAG